MLTISSFLLSDKFPICGKLREKFSVFLLLKTCCCQDCLLGSQLFSQSQASQPGSKSVS